MLAAVFFSIAVFLGWTIFDFVKYKKLSKENIISAIVAAIIAGVAWYILFIIF